MSFDFNILNEVKVLRMQVGDAMTVADLGDHCNLAVKSAGIEFEESEFTSLIGYEKANEKIYEEGLFAPRILCAARAGNNEGYYVYVYISTPTSMTPVLSAKGWTWQNMVAIQAVITTMLRDI